MGDEDLLCRCCCAVEVVAAYVMLLLLSGIAANLVASLTNCLITGVGNRETERRWLI